MEMNPSLRTPHTPTMPALAQGSHAHQHTVDSALVSLAALGVPPHRIRLRRSGRDSSASGTIVRQRPAPGEPLTSSTLVELDISGLGFTQALPVGMWDSGGEREPGTRELLEPLDDPLEKLRHWFNEGAPLFRIAPDDLGACDRWLALFGVRASEWPRPLWFRLASLIAHVPQFSCSQAGCSFVLEGLLGLPVRSFRYQPCETELPEQMLSALGAKQSNLGIDLLVGDRFEDIARLELRLGPMDLATYEYFAESLEGRSLLDRTLRLIMPASTQYEIDWAVRDERAAPRLGIAALNSRLGINTHLGDQVAAFSAAGNPEMLQRSSL